MKFTEAQLESAFIDLLKEEGDLGGMELPLRLYQKKTQLELHHSQKTPQEFESPR